MHRKLLSAVANRRAIREFDPDSRVSDDEIALILEAGGLTPSYDNEQPWRFVVVRDRDRIQSLVDLTYAQQIFETATCMIACYALVHSAPNSEDKDTALSKFPASGRHEASRVLENELPAAFRRTSAITGTAMAMFGMWLQATELGLGCCWIGALRDRDAVGRLCGIPDDAVRSSNCLVLVGLLAIGRPASEWPSPRTRLQMDRISCLESWAFDTSDK